MPIIVELSGSLRQYVYKQFRENGMSKEDAERRSSSCDTLYGVVDGHNSHGAIVRLRNTDKRWKEFILFVCLVNSGHILERYCQLARFQKALYDSSFLVENTFYGLIHNLRIEYESLKSRKLI